MKKSWLKTTWNKKITERCGMETRLRRYGHVKEKMKKNQRKTWSGKDIMVGEVEGSLSTRQSTMKESWSKMLNGGEDKEEKISIST
jgi:hypothetical protein